MGIFARGHTSSFFAPKSGLRCAGLLLIALCLYGNLWGIYSHSASTALAADATRSIPAATDTAPAAPDTASSDAASATAPGSISLSSIATNTSSTAPATGCVVALPYVSPSELDVLNLSDGLSVVIDTPYTYAVRATSLSGLRNAITSCAARARTAGDYHAITARQMTWTYTATPGTDGTCSLTSVRVGLHIAQFLPALSAQARLNASDLASWNAYETSLHTHENGHVTLARRYAEELTEKLQNMKTLSCSQLKAQAALTVTSVLTTLNTEDALYDSETRHGATQGAVL